MKYAEHLYSDLSTSRSWDDAPAAVRAANCNGCGPDGWKGDLIPETVLGVDTGPACCIHDWDYRRGTEISRRKADERFLWNMRRLVHQRGGWFAPVRLWAVWWRYRALVRFGGEFFDK